MLKGKIFFSYSRSDSDFVLKLAKDLREAGEDIWLDQLDIKAGTHWDTSIEKALDDSSRMFVILSPESVNSNNVLAEVSFALESDKTVIPILLIDCKVPFRLKRLQFIDFTTDYHKALNQLLLVLGYNQETSKKEEIIKESESNKKNIKEKIIEKEKKDNEKIDNELIEDLNLFNKVTNHKKTKVKSLSKNIKILIFAIIILITLIILIKVTVWSSESITNSSIDSGCSELGGEEISITLKNQSHTDLMGFWVNENCEEVFQGFLQDQIELPFNSRVGYSYRSYDMYTAELIHSFIVSKTSYIIIIPPPDPNKVKQYSTKNLDSIYKLESEKIDSIR